MRCHLSQSFAYTSTLDTFLSLLCDYDTSESNCHYLNKTDMMKGWYGNCKWMRDRVELWKDGFVWTIVLVSRSFSFLVLWNRCFQLLGGCKWIGKSYFCWSLRVVSTGSMCPLLLSSHPSSPNDCGKSVHFCIRWDVWVVHVLEMIVTWNRLIHLK